MIYRTAILSGCLLFAGLFFSTCTTLAQSWSLAVGPGVTQYIGDVNDGQIGENRMALNAEGWYALTDNIQLKSGFSVYGLRAQDVDATRMRSFRTTNVEFYSSALYYFRQGYLTPFAHVGIGATTSRPQGQSPLGYWNLRDVRPEGQKVPGLLAMVPFGVGLEYKVTPVLSVVVDAAARYVLSDQIDAVSQEIVSSDALSQLALDYHESLSDDVARQITEVGAITGGNPTNNDWYGIFSIKLKFTPTAGCVNPYKYSRPEGRRRSRRNFEPI